MIPSAARAGIAGQLGAYGPDLDLRGTKHDLLSLLGAAVDKQVPGL
jgi:hypothetical protein